MTTTMITKLPDLIPADLEGALLDLGITGRVKGDEMTALCPSPDHLDSSPSWSINLDTGKHHCFSCGFGGSFQWLVQIMKGIRSGEATAWIKMQKVRIGIAEEPLVVKEATVTESDLWPYIPPPFERRSERGISAESCDALEILWDKEKNRWVMVLRDPFTDRLIGWQTKGVGEESSLVDNYPPKVKKATTVFGYRNLKSTGTDGLCVVLENPLKAGLVWDAGYKRVVSTCGSSFTDYQINDLLWPVADEVVLMLDNDAAGHKAMHRFIMQNPYARSSTRVFNYNAQKINGAYVHTPDGRDPGDLSLDEIRKGIETATPAPFTYFKGLDYT
jgi:hypothetical protein